MDRRLAKTKANQTNPADDLVGEHFQIQKNRRLEGETLAGGVHQFVEVGAE